MILRVFCLEQKCGIYTHIYRVSKQQRSLFLEVIISVILNENMYMYMCPAPNIFPELFHCTVKKLLISSRYYILFLIPVFIVRVTK
jgi:hypothetical protein